MKILNRLALIVLLTMPLCVHAEIMSVIVNKNLDIQEMDKKQLRRMFMGKSKVRVGGEIVEPLDLNYETNGYQAFLENVLMKSQAQIDSYWSRRIFNGQGFPPRQVDDEKSIVELVANNSKYLGYISGTPASDKVKVIFSFEY